VTPVPVPAKQRRTSARAKAKAQAADRVVGYLRCSTDEQADSGLGLDAQRAAVEAACAAKGWTVTDWVVDEGVSGSVPPADRPAMARALRLLDGGEAGALVAAKVDRIARDLHDLTGLLRRADDDGWAVVALDLGVDTTTPVGRMLIGILGSVAEWERATIRQRTRDALAAKKAAGARLGRPVSPESLPARARLRELLHDRMPLAAIADTLNAEGYTTPTGLAWTWRHVQKTRDSLALDDEATAAL
jgi:DNA invertase Pin-like site-specific DNA recombinase